MLIRKITKSLLRHTGLSSLFYTNKLRKRCVITNKRKRFILVNITLLVFVFLGMGYSVLGNDLGIFGTLKVNKYVAPTLYNVLKTAAEEGTYAKEYTGEHQDSMAGVGDKKIYHWYAPNTTEGDTLAEEILNKNNVIFAGFCWQMIRTTDTGGVKMIYNGVPSNGICNNTGEDSTIGSSRFNENNNSLADSGYMYNTRYIKTIKSVSEEKISNLKFLPTSFWYADSISWDSQNNKYELVDPNKISSKDDYPNLQGKYTFFQGSQSSSYDEVYYVLKVVNGTADYVVIADGNNLADYDDVYTSGSSYTDNGDNSFTINSPSTMNRFNYSENRNFFVGKYICKNAINDTCSDLMCGFGTGSRMFYYTSSSFLYKYANGFTFSNGTYTLNSDSVSFWDFNSTNNQSLKTHHYTCFNTTGECTTLYYVFFNDILNGHLDIMELNDGKSIEDIKNEMLYNDNVNTTNSVIKTFIDTWYLNNLITYTDKLEDVIYCNNRNQNNANANGWNPNGGDISTILKFFSSSDLSCENVTDRFSISNTKAKLTYPIGLMTYGEALLLANTNLKKKDVDYFLMTPFNYSYNVVYHIAISSSSGVTNNTTSYVRPVISLKPGIEYASGDGSMADPFVVD